MPTTWGRFGRAPLTAASFAVARVRARPSRGLVTGLGIALAIAALFITTGTPIIAADATLRRALDELPAGERSITVAVTVNARSVDELRAMDAQVRGGLAAPGLGTVRSQVSYRALAAPDGTVFGLAGIERLAQAVVVRDGTLPQSCTPTRCEVVIAGDVASIALPQDLGLVVVGHVALTDPSLLTGQFLPVPNEVVLLGDGVEAVGAIEPLALIGRSIGWVAPIDPASIRVSEIDDVLAAAARITNLSNRAGATVDLPRDALVTARSRAATASNRVALAAAQGVVLLGAFALLAAAAARRQHRFARQLLLQRGASRATTNVFTIVEAAWPVAIGLVVGIPLGLGATAWLAERAHLDSAAIVASVLSASAARVAIGAVVLLLASAMVIAADSTLASGRPRRPWWRPMAIDGVGVGALGVGALALGRGDATPSSLVATGDPLLATLPLLAAVTAGWLAIRIVPLLIATAARLIGDRAPLSRAALGEVARRPIVPLATAGFLAAATTLGVFSLGYRSTLRAGAHDQAAFSIPFDISLTGGHALVRPPSIEPAGGWSALAPNVRSTDVLRRGVTVHSSQLTSDTVTVVGLDPSTLSLLRGWRSDFGQSPTELGKLITADGQMPPLGTEIPGDATSLVVVGKGAFDNTDITVVIARADGTWHEDAATYAAHQPDSLTVALEHGDAGGRLIGFRFAQPSRAAQLTQHRIGEGETSAASFTAEITLTAVKAMTSAGSPGRPLPIDWRGLRSDVASLTATGDGLDVAVTLQGFTALVVPKTSPSFTTLPAVVDPTTGAAAQNGVVTIDLPAGGRRYLRVVGVAIRFPGAPAQFAIVDRTLAQPSFDLLEPGFGTANEVWLAVDADHEASLATALGEAPYTDLVVARRHTLEEALRTDPLAEYTLGLFAVAALIAAVLAVAAVYLSAITDAAENSPLHRALAAEGVAPRSLSRMVRTSSIAIAICSIGLGAAGALAFLRLVTRVITVTATSTVPVPPLVARLPSGVLLVALAALFATCLVAGTVAAREARRAAQGDLLREFG